MVGTTGSESERNLDFVDVSVSPGSDGALKHQNAKPEDKDTLGV